MNGDTQAAIGDYSAAIQQQREFAPAYLNRGVARIESEEYDEAIRDLSDAIRLDDQLGEAFFHRGLVWGRKGESDKALEDLDQAMVLDPEFAPTYFSRAGIRMTQGEYELALADFDELIRLYPDMGAAYAGRGNVWIERGELAKAEDDYRQAILVDPGSADAYTVQRLVMEAAFHHRCERYREAIARASDALEINAECIPAIAARAAAYWYTELFVEATTDFTALLRLGGDSLIAHGGRGQVQVEMGEFDDALADLDEAVRLADEMGETTGLAYALCGRALAHAGLGHFDESVRDFDRSIRLCPSNAWVYYNLALYYHRRGRDGHAVHCFRLALRQADPPLTARKRARAEAYVRRNKESGVGGGE
jgi:tetratricopeptide (TPR) repeat protein